MNDLLSVVIPAHLPSEEFRACLKAFAAHHVWTGGNDDGYLEEVR